MTNDIFELIKKWRECKIIPTALDIFKEESVTKAELPNIIDQWHKPRGWKSLFNFIRNKNVDLLETCEQYTPFQGKCQRNIPYCLISHS